MRRLPPVAALLFFSGACALLYQVTWLRELRLIFGGSTPASSAVLAVFMAGLGVGGLWLGGRVDKARSALGVYANLELAIAVTVALTPGLVLLARAAYVATGGTMVLGDALGTLVRLALATLVLGVPTLLMGGTMPAAARAATGADDRSRSALAWLYGINTLGAVCGAALANFVLIEVLGNRLTLWAGCLINLLLAVFARVLARSATYTAESVDGAAAPVSAAAEPAAEQPLVEQPLVEQPLAEVGTAPLEPSPPLRFVMVASGVVGFAFLLLELVWYRMLGPLLGGSSYTFGLILALALLGIGLGGAGYAAARRLVTPTLHLFALTCVLEAAFVALPLAVGDTVALTTVFTRPLRGFGFSGLVAHWALIGSFIVVPAAIVSGFQFPLLVALLGRGGDHIGRDTGRTYAANTVGAIAGSLAGGFGLLPLLGAVGSWRLVSLLLVGLGVSAVFFAGGVTQRSRAALVPLAVAALALTCTLMPGPTALWRHSPIGAGRADHLVGLSRNAVRAYASDQRRIVRFETDGVESSIAIAVDSGASFVVNGKSDGHSQIDAPTQVFGGLLGAALHPKGVRRALVVGLGTGSTAGWLGKVPTIERVDTVEMEPAMREVARACAAVNERVLENPKVHLHIGDAREVLLATPERYDLVFSEPSNPYRAGISSLYTREFYEGAAARLAPGGLFAQWLQAYEIDGEVVRIAMATLASVFPETSVWQLAEGDLLLLGARERWNLDVATVRQRIAAEPFKRAMNSVFRADGLESLLARHVANSKLARAFVRTEPNINTDDLNLLEFSFARSVGREDGAPNQALWKLSVVRIGDRPDNLVGTVDWAVVNERRAALKLGVTTPDGSRRAPIINATLAFNGDNRPAHFDLTGLEPEVLAEASAAAEMLIEEHSDGALRFIEAVERWQPTEALALRALLFHSQKKLQDAAKAAVAALLAYRTDPWPERDIMHRLLTLVPALAHAERASAGALIAALEQPYAADAHDSVRRATLVRLFDRLEDPRCVDALAAFEANVPWHLGHLRRRLDCYTRTKHPLRERALDDVAQFIAGEPSPLDQRLPDGPLR